MKVVLASHETETHT